LRDVGYTAHHHLEQRRMTTTPRRAGARPTSRSARARGAADQRAKRLASTLDCFRRVIRVLRVSARQAEEKSALRPAQLFVLGQIAAAPNQSLSELAARTMTDRTSAASMVDRLAARGLVRRVRGAVDRRRIEIRLTPVGARVLARAPSSPTAHLLEGLERLDDDALDQLAAGLGELVRVMGAAEGRATLLFEDGAAPSEPRRRPRGA
jgi:DNA-binding MarR family transcriptional regulator